MLHAACIPLLPPSGVTHSLYGHFSGLTHPKELLTVAQHHVTLYRYNESGNTFAQTNDEENQQDSKVLDFVFECDLYAPPLAAATCRPPNSTSDVIVFLFDDAHVSFVVYNPKEFKLETVALVQLLDRDLLQNQCPLQPILRVDCSGTYVAVLVKRTALVCFPLLGFGTAAKEKQHLSAKAAEKKENLPSKKAVVQLNAWGDEDEEEETSAQPESTVDKINSSDENSNKSSYGPGILQIGTLTIFILTDHRQSLRNVRDFHFVESSGDPLLAILYEKYSTWAGRVKVLEWKSDSVENHMLTCSVTWISISQAQTSTPRLLEIGDVDYLSFTTTHLLPVPSFGGISASVLCVSAHSVSWVAAQNGVSAYINSYGEEESKDLRVPNWKFLKMQWDNPEVEQALDVVKTNLSFSNAAIIPLVPQAREDVLTSASAELSLLLITEEEGTVVKLTLMAEGYSIVKMSADILVTGCFCSAHAQLSDGLFFFGSCCSDSRVVSMHHNFESVQVMVPSMALIHDATPIEDMDLPSPQESAQELLDDSIRGSPYEALYRRILVAPAQDSLRSTDGMVDLAVSCGKGETGGAICILRQSIRDQVLTTESDIHGTSVFFIRSETYSVTSSSENSYLLISGPKFSMYFTVTEKIDQVRNGVLRDVTRTIFAASMDWMNAVIQVTENEIVLASLDGKTELFSTNAFTLMGRLCTAVKNIFLVPTAHSVYFLFEDGTLLEVICNSETGFTTRLVLENVVSATYWKSKDKVVVVHLMDLIFLTPSNREVGRTCQESKYVNFAVLPPYAEEGTPVALAPMPSKLEKESLPVVNHMHIYDHPNVSGSDSSYKSSSSVVATLICTVSSGEMLTYRIVEADSFGPNRLLKDIVHFLDVECEREVIEKVEEKKRRLETERRVKPLEEVENEALSAMRLVEFECISQLSGVYVCGQNPVFLFFDRHRQRLSVCRHHVKGGVKSFAVFDTPSFSSGYVYCSCDSAVKFALPSTGVSPTMIGNGWWMRKIPLGASPHQVLYVPEERSCLVVTSTLEPFSPQKAPFDVSLSITYDSERNKTVTIKPNIAPPPLAATGNNSVPLNERFCVQLLSCQGSPLASLQLEANEKVLCAERVKLPCNVTVDTQSENLTNVYAFGTGFPLGEDVATTGRLMLVTTRFDGEVHQLQVIHSEPMKGPVTAVTQIDRHLAVAVGGVIRVYQFNWKAGRCETIAMLYAGVYISAMSAFKDYLCFGDLSSSVTMVRFSAANRSLTVLGKDIREFSVTQCEMMYHEGDFGIISTDEKRNLVIFGYTPRTQESQGRKVVLQSLLSTDSEYRVPGGCITKLIRFRSLSSQTRSSMLYTTNYGEIGCLVTIGALANRTLQWVVQRLQNDTPHPCGLPPQVFLSAKKEHPRWDIAAKHRVVHGPLIQELYRLDLRARKSLAAAALTQLEKTLRIGAALAAESWIL